MKKLILLLMLFSGCSTTLEQIHQQTVMIMNLEKTSGGSGSIIKSNLNMSLVLTNAHICDVVSSGGYVITDDNVPHSVLNYRKSKMHDLCVIEVADDLKYNAVLAARAPQRYEPAVISGHPRLLPTIITNGEFTDKRVITIMMGLTKCKEEDYAHPRLGVFCSMFGRVPLLRSFRTILISALIQPGSSGSAVYDSNGNVGAVIFAGSCDLSYGSAVPYEYVAYFMNTELNTLERKLPNDPTYKKEQEINEEVTTKYLEYCKNVKEPGDPRDICDLIESESEGCKK